MSRSWCRDRKIAERMEREEREAGRSYGPAYQHIIGPAPACAPGDLKSAAKYLKRIMKAIKIGHWTNGEWQMLYELRDKWYERAGGTDEWYNVYGTRQPPVHEYTIEQRKHDAALRDRVGKIIRVIEDDEIEAEEEGNLDEQA